MWKVPLTILMLAVSNVFMTYAWYGHLKNFATKPWIFAVVISWLIAFFEYMIQVPANRLGATVLTVGQLKIIQEVISLSIFVPFSIFFLKEKLTLDYFFACLCILGAVFFVFRAKIFGN